MNGSFQRNPAVAVLAALAALLVVALALEVTLGGRETADAPPRRTVPAEAKLLPPLAPVVPEQAYAETAARPLFVPTRRPAPEVATAAAPAFQRGQFTLQGVIVIGGDRTAMLREKANGRIHRVEAGKEVNGVKVLKIDPATVTIGMGDEREDLSLSVQRQAIGAPGAPGSVPPQALAGQGPFAPSRSAFPAPGAPPQGVGQPGIPPRLPQGAQSLSAGSVPFPPGPQNIPANPVASPGAAPPPGAATDTMPMTPEELLARRRARRAQQNQ
ncbi:MAG: hypothetical protein ABIR98_02435 [Usitatibacter sp.]